MDTAEMNLLHEPVLSIMNSDCKLAMLVHFYNLLSLLIIICKKKIFGLSKKCKII